MAHSNPITIGMLAHVDAGKTTLSEAILYSAGSIRKLGRVDNQDTFLDTGDMERARGITIFSKQAAYNYNGSSYTLLDTPGHVDFSAEMERTLAVLVMHKFPVMAMKLLLRNRRESILTDAGMMLVSVFLCLLAERILSRICPAVFGKRKGSCGRE